MQLIVHIQPQNQLCSIHLIMFFIVDLFENAINVERA